ncbi:MAG: permease-like cell division protein FtsX [Elusimicrobiaceae bacterium]|nr:permease-like cell division protein FtsX [Elusimicrobiaceae bacterium]
MDELFETDDKKKKVPKQIGHLYRKLFLLVFAVALLAQGLVIVEKTLTDYYDRLADSFKVILTVDDTADDVTLQQWGQTLSQKQDITSVHLLSSEDALAVVRHKNPQLVDALLALGKNQMPAYFEITLATPALNNIRPFVDNLDAEYESLTPHYNLAQAKMLFYTGLCAKLIRLIGLLSLLAFLAFMFLVEAAPYPAPHAWRGGVSGILAGVVGALLIGGIIYPTGFLQEMLPYLTSWSRQALLLVFCGLLGWTLAKWQKF